MKLYGLDEIAQALGTDKRKLSVWRSRGKLPPPDFELAMGPAWKATTIEPWIADQRRSPSSTSANGVSE